MAFGSGHGKGPIEHYFFQKSTLDIVLASGGKTNPGKCGTFSKKDTLDIGLASNSSNNRGKMHLFKKSNLDIVRASSGSTNPGKNYMLQTSTMDIGLASGGSKKSKRLLKMVMNDDTQQGRRALHNKACRADRSDMIGRMEPIAPIICAQISQYGPVMWALYGPMPGRAVRPCARGPWAHGPRAFCIVFSEFQTMSVR